jgi:hypothetical protein
MAADPPTQLITMRHTEMLTVTTVGGLPRFNMNFDIEHFNAPNVLTSSAGMPMYWSGRDFAVDLGSLPSALPDKTQLATWEEAARAELSGWSFSSYSGRGNMSSAAAQKTVSTLLSLILSGHADLARNFLARAWPVGMGGQDVYWHDLSDRIVKHRLWQQFALDRIPNANLVIDAARAQLP